MNFFGKFGAIQTIWYPAPGFRDGGDGSLDDVARVGYYWSASPSSSVYCLYFSYQDAVDPSDYYGLSSGRSVRCLQE
jgi:hypothetical protein